MEKIIARKNWGSGGTKVRRERRAQSTGLRRGVSDDRVPWGRGNSALCPRLRVLAREQSAIFCVYPTSARRNQSQEVRVLLRKLVSFSLLPLSALLVAQTSTEPHGQLPVRRVVLYKNGVGYFEHAGRVTGNQALTIDFTSSQLDDALQSLTALDLGGGRITGVGYNSTTPLEQQLKNIPLGLDDQPSTEELYGALRGARVEVSGPGEAALAGRIVSYETRSQKTPAGDTVERAFLTVVSDAGAVRTFELAGATSVRILDGGLRRDLDEYLALLASTQSQQVRHLTLQAQGTGTRDIRVSYISEVPVWKSTYRIVFPESKSGAAAAGPETAILQGWAVVDNTVGSDWNNVQLSLVAGAPQSFIEPLSQPIYTQRPEVPVPEAANIAPVTHEGAIGALSAAPAVPQASQSVMVNGANGGPIANAAGEAPVADPRIGRLRHGRRRRWRQDISRRGRQ